MTIEDGIYGEIDESSVDNIYRQISGNSKDLVTLIKNHKRNSGFNEGEVSMIKEIAESFIDINPQNLTINKGEISGQISDKDVGVGKAGTWSKHRSRREVVTAIFGDLIDLGSNEVSVLTDISERKKLAAQKIVEIARDHIYEKTAIYETPIAGPGVEPRAAWSEPTYMEPTLLQGQSGTIPGYLEPTSVTDPQSQALLTKGADAHVARMESAREQPEEVVSEKQRAAQKLANAAIKERAKRDIEQAKAKFEKRQGHKSTGTMGPKKPAAKKRGPVPITRHDPATKTKKRDAGHAKKPLALRNPQSESRV